MSLIDLQRIHLLLCTLPFFLLAGCKNSLPSLPASLTPGAKVRQVSIGEASMNFDMADVKPFLKRIPPLLDSGFSKKETLQVYKATKALKVETEKTLKFAVRYKGRETPLNITIIMDDVDAPDMYFFTHPELANKIQREMGQFAKEQEKKHGS